MRTLQRSARPAPRQFSPRDVGGLVLWLRGARLSGGLGVGEGVDRWVDLAASRDFSQPTASARPTTAQSSVLFGAQQVLTFDGGDYVEAPFSDALNPATFTLFAVLRVTGGASTFRAVVSSRALVPNRGFILYASDTNVWSFWTGAGSGAFQVLNGSGVVTNAVTLVTCTQEAANKRISVNGGADATAATAYTPAPVNPFRVGAGVNEGAASLFLPGNLAEVLLYNRALDAGERTRINRLLGRRYGVAIA